MLPPMMTTSELDAFFEQGWNRHDVDRLMSFMAEVDGCDLFTFAGGKIARKSSFLKTRTG